MIESNRPEENKTDDVKMFFEQFQDGEPAPKAEKPDDAFDTQAKQRFEPEAPKPTFKQAFAAARKAGDKVFEFGGKKFTTAMKGETKQVQPAASKPAAPAAKSSSSMDEYKAAADAGIARDKIKLPDEPQRPGIMASMREKDKSLNDKIIAGATKGQPDMSEAAVNERIKKVGSSQ